MKKRLECNITGRVQMVMFRDFTQRNATKLGIAGTVQNMEDGSVYVVAEGEEEKLQKLLELLKKGPLFASAENTKEQWGQPTGEFVGFHIEY